MNKFISFYKKYVFITYQMAYEQKSIKLKS